MDLNKLPNDHHLKVPDRIWNQLESKLDIRKKESRIRRLRIISSVAACLVLVTGYIAINQYNTFQSFERSYSASKLEFESLDSSAQPRYDAYELNKLQQHVVEHQIGKERKSKLYLF